MERIETINLKTETDALEAGHGITLYTFDEYGRLMHYAHIVASTLRTVRGLHHRRGQPARRRRRGTRSAHGMDA